MTGNICCTCFSRIFVQNQLPSYIKCVETAGACKVCDSKSGYFYARDDEIELAKQYFNTAKEELNDD